MNILLASVIIPGSQDPRKHRRWRVAAELLQLLLQDSPSQMFAGVLATSLCLVIFEIDVQVKTCVNTTRKVLSLYGTKYSRMDLVKFVDHIISNFFKGCLPQILLCPYFAPYAVVDSTGNGEYIWKIGQRKMINHDIKPAIHVHTFISVKK